MMLAVVTPFVDALKKQTSAGGVRLSALLFSHLRYLVISFFS